MALPLPVIGTVPAGASWAAFQERCGALVARMEMATCDGCDGCGLRCMDGFKVTRQEYEAVRTYLLSLPPDEVARVLHQEKTVPWPGAEEEATVTYCRYRDMEKGNCFVYPVRPTICRLFGHTPWLPCPIEAVRRVPDGSPELWTRYAAFERKTWDQWERPSDAKGSP